MRSPGPQGTPKVDAARFHDATFEHMLGAHVATMHLQKCASEAQVLNAVAMTEDAVSFLCKRLLQKISACDHELQREIKQVIDTSLAAIKRLYNVKRTCAEVTPCAVEPVKRPMGLSADENAKHFGFFSLIHLIEDVLKNDAVARKHCLESSKFWSTGALYKKYQDRVSDFQDTKRFRWSPLARPADPHALELDGALRVRVGIDGWNDDFTVHRVAHAAIRAVAEPVSSHPPCPLALSSPHPPVLPTRVHALSLSRPDLPLLCYTCCYKGVTSGVTLA